MEQVVKKICLDGAKELTESVFYAYTESCGIIHQVTMLYTHSQNGKIECYLRTLEETVQMLMADSALPPTFYGDAVLTAQYIRNCVPTSTLPTLQTPYEGMEGSKPDLSHLWVWGCQCFLLIPQEICTKGGLK